MIILFLICGRTSGSGINWLEILHRYLHVQTAGPKDNPHAAPRIFPRYHQWDAVQRMVADAREQGAGQDYLIEHSAGSGKSNTIAWLAHRLSTLFSDANEQVFHKVIVITDRTVLDRQLQRTIYQFDHTPGVVMRIDEDSAQLAAALEDSTSKIIISTLQKFPYVLGKIAGTELGGKRYAVIVDEAHSSQGGDAAARLRQAIGADNEAAAGRDAARVPGPDAAQAAEPVVLRVHRDADVADAEPVRPLRPGAAEPRQAR